MNKEDIILNIDYSRSLQEMIQAGNYCFISDRIIEKNFPFLDELKGKKVSVSAKLFPFSFIARDLRVRGSYVIKGIVDKMNQHGYPPATLAELLALREFYPELWKNNAIISLGSICRNPFSVLLAPIIYFHDNSSYLDLSGLDCEWDDFHSFLGVSNKLLSA